MIQFFKLKIVTIKLKNIWRKKEPKKAARCIKAAIQKKHINLKNDTDLDARNAFVGECLCCEAEVSCSLRELLNQPDCGDSTGDGGALSCTRCNDYEDGYQMYVMGFCEGKQQVDNGSFHNHCDECKGLGVCMWDHRNAHCHECGGHYFAGIIGSFNCNKCHPDSPENLNLSDSDSDQ